MASADAKKKCRQYSQGYLKFGFIPSFSNETMPMCLLCQKVFTNDAMKPSKMKDHLERVHPDKKNKDVEFFKVLKEKIRNQPNLKSFFKAPGTVDCEGGLKKDSEPVLKCIPLSAKTVQRCIDEMASDVEKILVSELQHSKFSIQLDESAFGCWNVLMAYKLEEGADVSDRDLEIYINHLEKLEEDFKIRFEDLESMTVPDWIIAPFDIETGNANIEFSLQKEHVEMSADLEAKLLFKHKSLSEFWSNAMDLEIADDLLSILLLYAIPDSYESFRIAIVSRPVAEARMPSLWKGGTEGEALSIKPCSLATAATNKHSNDSSILLPGQNVRDFPLHWWPIQLEMVLRLRSIISYVL
ncbi:hypothetical protein D917_03783 [Trichinella nativa]|uniref:Zinc finger BED domain-containing protein 5 n=1 Tax=Trichinella nativa TaxID=6335 RepID=A0A1Y3ECJ4_9BILA|nr:hypothetical protein D917_03783 [Trichinella nativa]